MSLRCRTLDTLTPRQQAFLGLNLETVFDASRDIIIETLEGSLESVVLVESCSSVLANLAFTKSPRVMAWFQEILPRLIETYDSAPASHFGAFVKLAEMEWGGACTRDGDAVLTACLSLAHAPYP